ncbi:MAG TPA: 3-deoxy-manno-octulosonate cytidylyltransferase [Caldimonas sp.]|nr:3-deoxy-manno-octulosonate cytidylyltransferase [Caldimonas sp.]
MQFDVLIPARLASTRLPGKPLADIAGVPMIVRVARRAMRSQARSVTVAADDAAIVDACTRHDVAALLTDPAHPSGSDRLAEAAIRLGLDGDDIVVNVQGDEPMIDPVLIDACAGVLALRRECVMSTAAHPLRDAGDFENPNVVKVVLDRDGRALYFSRSPIPWPRDGAAAGAPSPLRHVGLYAYRAAFLRRFPTLPPAPLEIIERLEQLRVLWHGERIAVHVGEASSGIGVDTPQDLAKVRALFESNGGAGFA